MCLHPLASAEECSGGAIKAHTVSRSSLLEIARDGHVYSISRDLAAIIKTGKLSAELVGINKASVFTEFCARHDHATFQPVDAGAYESLEQASFLLGYRALCLELFNKLGVDSLEQMSRDLDRGLDLDDQIAHQLFVGEHHHSVKIAIRDLLNEKERQDNALVHSDYSEARYLLFRLRCTPDVMCSGAFFPQFDFAGNRLQDLADPSPAEILAFSAVGNRDGGWLLFSWFGEGLAPMAFTRSLLSLGEASIPNAIVRFIFESFENAYVAPLWWEARQDWQRNGLVERMRRAADPREELRPDYLKNDGRVIVDWQITGTYTNAGQ